MEFMGRDFLTLMDYTKEEIDFILNTAADFKNKLAKRACMHAMGMGTFQRITKKQISG